MSWKIRVIVAWSFRIMGCIVTLGVLTVIVYFTLIFQGDNAVKAAYSSPFTGGSLPWALCGLFVTFELMGRLLSWTNPMEFRLPRFHDDWR